MRPLLAFRNKASPRFAKKTNRLLLTSTRDWWYIFDSRSTFDLVMAGQRSIFGEIDVFFNFTRRQYRRSYGRYRHETFTTVFGGQLASF